MHIRKILHGICYLWHKPIIVFCFHKVSDVFDSLYGGIDDWTETEQFKHNIYNLQKKYTFISIEEAYKHLLHDKFRFRSYAVLTSDDGYQCILDILPWLEKEKIPITLFLSTQYLNGQSYDPWFDAHWKGLSIEEKIEVVKNMYIQKQHLPTIDLISDNVSLSIHGYGHEEVSTMDAETFGAYVKKCREILEAHPRYKAFYAYTWGRHSDITDRVLCENGIVPVYCDGKENVLWDGIIHRICIDGKLL